MTTRDAEDLLPAIDDKLASVADAAPTPPAWYDAWMRLGPESTAEDRLAVYRAVRDSHCLPAIVAFSLVAWQIEDMVYQDAESGLRDLYERMEALERAYAEEEGELWPDDDVPQEYAELSRQYDDAWDRIFLAKLESLGEAEIADQYRADHEEFERRCDLGLQFFDAKVIVRKPPPPDELVRVASCWDPPRADVVQMALAREGIPSALGNACFLSWFWHYGNAVGGVTVHVRYRDAQQAREVLAAARVKPSVSLPPWTCASCGQRVAGQWDACWQCGASRDGAEVPAGDEEAAESAPTPEADETGGSRLLAVLVALVMIAFILIGGPLLALAAAPFVVMFLLAVQWNRQNAAAHPAADAPNESTPSGLDEPTATRSRIAQAIVVRAWRAAVLGFFFFPPLGLYSLWLLKRLAARETPLGDADWLRFCGAVIVNICTIFAWLLSAALLTRTFDIVWFLLRSFFGNAIGFPPW